MPTKRRGNLRQLPGPLSIHRTHIWCKDGFQPTLRKDEKKPIANVNCASGCYVLGGRPATPCDLNRLEEWARSEVMKFSKPEVILPHHLLLLKTHLCTASSSGLPSTKKTLTNWRESSSDHEGGDEAAAQGVQTDAEGTRLPQPGEETTRGSSQGSSTGGSGKNEARLFLEADKDRTWGNECILQDGTFQLGVRKFLHVRVVHLRDQMSILGGAQNST